MLNDTTGLASPPTKVGARTNFEYHYYHPQTKLREGNVFTHVCDSVHGGGGLWPRGVSVWEGFVQGGLCPGGVSVQGVSVQGD